LFVVLLLLFVVFIIMIVIVLLIIENYCLGVLVMALLFAVI